MPFDGVPDNVYTVETSLCLHLLQIQFYRVAPVFLTEKVARLYTKRDDTCCPRVLRMFAKPFA